MRERRQELVAAILLAVMLHLLLVYLLPIRFWPQEKSSSSSGVTLDLFLEAVEAAEPPEERYVQAPLDVPERKPEQTLNFSDRDQVGAQEQAVAPDPLNNPALDGDEADSNRIVQGNPREQPTRPSPPAASPSTAESPSPRQEAAPQTPPAVARQDVPDAEPESDAGIVSLPRPADAPEPEEAPQENAQLQPQRSPFDGSGRDAVTTPEQTAAEPNPTPRPQPRVERNTSFGPLRDSRQGSLVIGNLAFDSMYRQFGEYWRRVAEIIEARWRNLVYNTRAIRFGGYRVAVRFDILRDGAVGNVEVVHSSAGRLAETISVDAIVGEAPFFPWTPDMILTMGERTTVQIVFIY